MKKVLKIKEVLPGQKIRVIVETHRGTIGAVDITIGRFEYLIKKGGWSLLAISFPTRDARTGRILRRCLNYNTPVKCRVRKKC